jgi:hypothetical protein
MYCNTQRLQDCHDRLLYIIRYRTTHTMHAQCVLNQSTWTVSCSRFVSAYSHTVHLTVTHISFWDTVLGEMNISILHLINYDLLNAKNSVVLVQSLIITHFSFC